MAGPEGSICTSLRFRKCSRCQILSEVDKFIALLLMPKEPPLPSIDKTTKRPLSYRSLSVTGTLSTLESLLVEGNPSLQKKKSLNVRNRIRQPSKSSSGTFFVALFGMPSEREEIGFGMPLSKSLPLSKTSSCGPLLRVRAKKEPIGR